MVGFGEIKFLEVFVKDDDGIADEEVGEVVREQVIHAACNETLLEVFIDDQIGVEILGP